MTNVAVRVENLGKKYRIRHEAREHYHALRDVIANAASSPARWLGSLRRRDKSASERMLGTEDFWALRNVGFQIDRGEVLGIIGPNGAGKSTLLKILSRITEPTEGKAVLAGRVASLLEVGTGFHPELTGRENIYLNGAILGMRRAEIDRDFDAIVDFAEVERFLDTPVKRYSSGMYVRLAFAVAAHMQPDILIVDEVLAVGDAKFQKKCLGKMESVARDVGRTIIFVSHDMTAVRRLCSNAILLDGGKTLAHGRTHEVVRCYLEDNLSRSTERNWPDACAMAPGDDIVRLLSVRCLDGKGKPARTFSVREDLWLQIEFRVLSPGHCLDAGFYVYNEENRVLFSVGDFQVETWHEKARPPGVHVSACRIPANLLNEGRYTIMCYVSEHPYTLRAIVNDALSLEVVDDMQPGGARGNYSRPWPRAEIRPLLHWDLEFKGG